MVRGRGRRPRTGYSEMRPCEISHSRTGLRTTGHRRSRRRTTGRRKIRHRTSGHCKIRHRTTRGRKSRHRDDRGRRGSRRFAGRRHHGRPGVLGCQRCPAEVARPTSGRGHANPDCHHQDHRRDHANRHRHPARSTDGHPLPTSQRSHRLSPPPRVHARHAHGSRRRSARPLVTMPLTARGRDGNHRPPIPAGPAGPPDCHARTVVPARSRWSAARRAPTRQGPVSPVPDETGSAPSRSGLRWSASDGWVQCRLLTMLSAAISR